MSYFKQNMINRLLNIPGWHTNRKIVVLESDDWGSIRMPSVEAMSILRRNGMKLENDPYSVYDSLETEKDFEMLFNVLHSFKDKNNRNPVITANTIMVNPDFQKIKESDFEQYHFELFTETLKRTQSNSKTLDIIKNGINQGIYFPQFHGREHVNVKNWLSDLKINHGSSRLWFDLGSFGTSQLVDNKQRWHYMTTWDSNSPEALYFYSESVSEGLKLFENVFGYKSKSIIAPTYYWPLELESCFKLNGIEFLQGTVLQKIPVKNGNKVATKRTNFQGTKSKSGLIYLNRNAFFEPSMNPEFDWENDCLRRINIAFSSKKPATISVHRLNFMGTLNSKNREINLNRFKNLLKKILITWPDVEFMSSVELGDMIKNEKL